MKRIVRIFFFHSLKLNECTLRKRLNEGTATENLGRFKRTFSVAQEEEIAEYCWEMDSLFYGLTLRSFRRLVYQYAMMNNIPNTFNEESKLAGRDFVKSFLKRHKLSLRMPMKTSMARMMGFNKSQVDLFFANLTTLLEKHNFQPRQMYNMDESGFSTVPNYTKKVISSMGKKLVGKAVAADRGTLITAVCCFNAVGDSVTPMLIFPQKRKKDSLMNDASAGAQLAVSDSGYINTVLFDEWMHFFQEEREKKKAEEIEKKKGMPKKKLGRPRKNVGTPTNEIPRKQLGRKAKNDVTPKACANQTVPVDDEIHSIFCPGCDEIYVDPPVSFQILFS